MRLLNDLIRVDYKFSYFKFLLFYFNQLKKYLLKCTKKILIYIKSELIPFKEDEYK